jgi:2-desacetyl-2-hydroxyethyl bacteriochlorophyllide A dehydrogenase
MTKSDLVNKSHGSLDSIHGLQWRIKEPQTAVLESLDIDLSTIASSQFVVQTLYSAVSPGTELAIFRGIDPDVHAADGWCRYPWSAGYAGVGRVIRVGNDVQSVRVGDIVTGILGHASHWVMDDQVGQNGKKFLWSDRFVGKVRQPIPLEQAAFVRLYGIAMTAIQALHPLRWGQILVSGLGTIGTMVAQLAMLHGFSVTGVDPSCERRQAVMRDGISAIDPHSLDKRTDRWDAVVDTVGLAVNTVMLPNHLNIGGVLVLMTHWRSQPPIDCSSFINEIFNKGLTVRGALEYGMGSLPWENWPELQRAKWNLIEEHMQRGRLAFTDFETVPYNHLPRAYKDLDTRHGPVGRLLDWTSLGLRGEPKTQHAVPM